MGCPYEALSMMDSIVRDVGSLCAPDELDPRGLQKDQYGRICLEQRTWP